MEKVNAEYLQQYKAHLSQINKTQTNSTIIINNEKPSTHDDSDWDGDFNENNKNGETSHYNNNHWIKNRHEDRYNRHGDDNRIKSNHRNNISNHFEENLCFGNDRHFNNNHWYDNRGYGYNRYYNNHWDDNHGYSNDGQYKNNHWDDNRGYGYNRYYNNHWDCNHGYSNDRQYNNNRWNDNRSYGNDRHNNNNNSPNFFQNKSLDQSECNSHDSEGNSRDSQSSTTHPDMRASNKYTKPWIDQHATAEEFHLTLSRKSCSSPALGTALTIQYLENYELTDHRVNVNGKAPNGSREEMQPLSPKRMKIIEKAFFDNCGLTNDEAKRSWKKAIDAMNKKISLLKKLK